MQHVWMFKNMAAGKQAKLAVFRARLEELECPFIDGVDDSWIEELLYKPGEPRMRLLQWLLGRFDPVVCDVLENQQSKTDGKNDSRLQRLLFVAHLLGLCKIDDIALIRGDTTKHKQQAFMENLIDMVHMVSSRASHPKYVSTPGGLSVPTGVSASDQFEHDCQFLDLLCRQEDLSDVFKARIQLYPPDLIKDSIKAQERRLPDNKHLSGVADQLARELDEQNKYLEQLRDKIPFSEADDQTVERMNKTLELQLSTLSQMVVGFQHCYEAQMKPWCKRPRPELSDAGPAFKRVHSLLQRFVELLQSLDTIKSSHGEICQRPVAQQKREAPVDQTALQHMMTCIKVLEDSQQRQKDRTQKATAR